MKRYQKGIIPLAILGIGFLTLSLVGVTAVASNPELSLSINSWAKAKQKTWRDYGSPKLRREAYEAATGNETTSGNLTEQVKLIEYNAQQAEKLAEDERPKITGSDGVERPATDEEIQMMTQLQGDIQEKMTKITGSDGVERPATTEEIRQLEELREDTQERMTTITEGDGVERPATTEEIRQLQEEKPLESPERLTQFVNEFGQPLTGAGGGLSNLTPEQLQAQSYADRRALSNTTLTTTIVTYEPDPNLASNMKKVETVITRNLATGTTLDTQTNETVVTKDARKLGTTETEITYEEKTSSETKPAGLWGFTLGETKYDQIQTDTFVQRDEKGNVIETYVKQYNVSADGQKQENKVSEFFTNLGYKISPPKGTKSYDESSHEVGETWIAKDSNGVYHKYVKDAVGSHIDTSFEANVETVVGRERTTTIVTDSITGEIITSSSKPNKPTLWQQVIKSVSRANQNEQPTRNPGDVWLEKLAGGRVYVRKTQLENGAIKTESFTNIRVEPAEGPENDSLVITNSQTGEYIGTINDPEKAAELKKLNEQSAPKSLEPKIYPPNSTIVEGTRDFLGGRIDEIIQTNKDGQVVDRSYAYYTNMGEEPSRFEQVVSDIINLVYSITLPR